MKLALKRKHIYLSLLAAAVAGGFYLYQNAEGMIIRTTEKIASEALGVSVDIGGLHLALAEKKLTVRSIKIGNPAGFKQPHAVTAETVDVTLADFSSKEIKFKNITVNGSVVFLELGDKGMNVLALKERMASKEQKQKAANETIKVIIDHMLISATTIRPSITLLGDNVGDINMPALTLDGIGRGRSVTAGDAIVQIMDQYLSLVAKQARNTGVLKHVPGTDDIKNGAEDAAKSIRNLF